MDQAGLNFNPPIGQPQRVDQHVRRIVAPNASPMTFRGTNTYLVGQKYIAVIDPGPNDPAHLSTILNSLEDNQTITHILVTHSHIDHSPLARPLAEKTGAKIFAYGPTGAGQSEVMKTLIASGYHGGGEGSDDEFTPDFELRDGDELHSEDWSMSIIETPGHFSNHISFALNDSLFSGDHVMDWATSMVSPPDGDVSDFMVSCRKLLATQWRIFFPGHGAPVHNPQERVKFLIKHRTSREQQILHALKTSPATPMQLAEKIYVETPQALLGAAARNVFAHLIDLKHRHLVDCESAIGFDVQYALR